MATLADIYKAYQIDAPNVEEIAADYSPYGWNTPWDWGDTADDTSGTTNGLASIYPYSQIGGGGGGVEGTLLTPRPGASTPGYTLVNDPLDPFFMQRPSPKPNRLVRAVNWLTKRPTATESFAGGEGGVGSLAGVTMGEKGLLNELLAEGYLVNTPGGLKTTSGKNVVSWKGGYEEGQEKAYQNYLDDYGGEDDAEQNIIDKHGKKSAFFKRFKESQVVHNYRAQQAKDIKIAQENIITGRDKKIADKVIKPTYTPTDQGGGATWSPSGADLSPGGGPGQSPTGADVGYGTPFRRGGRVRYSNGGIVDLL